MNINIFYWERCHMMLFLIPIVTVACNYMIFFFHDQYEIFSHEPCFISCDTFSNLYFSMHFKLFKFPINANIQTNNEYNAHHVSLIMAYRNTSGSWQCHFSCIFRLLSLLYIWQAKRSPSHSVIELTSSNLNANPNLYSSLNVSYHFIGLPFIGSWRAKPTQLVFLKNQLLTWAKLGNFAARVLHMEKHKSFCMLSNFSVFTLKNIEAMQSEQGCSSLSSIDFCGCSGFG